MSERPSEKTGRVVGVDYGTVRVGLAISDPARRIASPLENYTRRDKTADAARFRRLVEEERVTLFVVGLPVFASGDESAKSLEARSYGKWIAETTGVPVEFYDERYSSAMAESWLAEGELTSKQRKKRRDMLAAHFILASYLESQEKGAAEPGALED